MTGSSGAGVTCGGRKVAVVIAPVMLGGLVWPSPVRNICTMLPLVAGLPGPFGLLSWFKIAPGPLPDAFSVNRPGAAAATLNGYALELSPAYSIHTEGLELAAISYGTTADT